MITKSKAIKAFPIVRSYGLLGKGMFSAVFKETDNTVLVVSDDPAKECLALGWMPDSDILPRVERLEYGNEGMSLYRMPLYKTFRAPKSNLNKKGYEQYLEFRSIRDRLSSSNYIWDAIKILSTIPTDNAIFVSSCIESLSNYTEEVGFEISPRNIASNEDGDLVLLDCFFDKARLLTRGEIGN